LGQEGRRKERKIQKSTASVDIKPLTGFHFKWTWISPTTTFTHIKLKLVMIRGCYLACDFPIRKSQHATTLG